MNLRGNVCAATDGHGCTCGALQHAAGSMRFAGRRGQLLQFNSPFCCSRPFVSSPLLAVGAVLPSSLHVSVHSCGAGPPWPGHIPMEYPSLATFRKMQVASDSCAIDAA